MGEEYVARGIAFREEVITHLTEVMEHGKTGHADASATVKLQCCV